VDRGTLKHQTLLQDICSSERTRSAGPAAKLGDAAAFGASSDQSICSIPSCRCLNVAQNITKPPHLHHICSNSFTEQAQQRNLCKNSATALVLSTVYMHYNNYTSKDAVPLFALAGLPPSISKPN
jgi:hypothetical protein